MKITEIKSYPVWVGHRNQMLVKVETDRRGVFGWGESGLSGREQAVAGAVAHLREWLIGRDPMKRGALWQEVYRSQYFEGDRVLLAAMSAIDIALYDLVGKAEGVPTYELLGGKHRDTVHTFATTSAPLGPEMIEQGKRLIDAGWNCFRLSSDSMGIVGGGTPRRSSDLRGFHRAGDAPLTPALSLKGRGNEKRGNMSKSLTRTLSLGERVEYEPGLFEPRVSIANTAEWFIKTREALGREVVLGVDYHHRLSVAETASFCQMMPDATLDFLEEPIRDESPEAYEALRKLTPMPFAIGEEFASKWQFLPFIERGLTNYARLDICNVGGFTEAMKVAGWAEAHYIDLMPHNPLGPICTAATVHFAAAVPNFAWLETWRNRWSPDPHESDAVFKTALKFDRARFVVPDVPGIGVEVNEAALSEPFRFWEAPHLHRSDGSYTNW